MANPIAVAERVCADRRTRLPKVSFNTRFTRGRSLPPPVTYSARQVLADCRLALQMLEQETDLQHWRIKWVAAVTLTRAVGHVLEKVDGANPAIRAGAKRAFSRWKLQGPDDLIFCGFIEEVRNNILKEYEFNIDPRDNIELVVISEPPIPTTAYSAVAADNYAIGENLYRPLVDGFRAGDDARDVLSDAIAWWERELDAIDAEASRAPDPPHSSD